MIRTALADDLIEWLDKAAKGKTIYHREREQLWDSFIECIDSTGEIDISSQQFNSIKGFLVCRNDHLTNDKELAFITAVEEISKQVDSHLLIAHKLASKKSEKKNEQSSKIE